MFSDNTCRLYTWHKWTQGEIDMFEYFSDYKGIQKGERIDKCACGATRVVKIEYQAQQLNIVE